MAYGRNDDPDLSKVLDNAHDFFFIYIVVDSSFAVDINTKCGLLYAQHVSHVLDSSTRSKNVSAILSHGFYHILRDSLLCLVLVNSFGTSLFCTLESCRHRGSLEVSIEPDDKPVFPESLFVCVHHLEFSHCCSALRY